MRKFLFLLLLPSLFFIPKNLEATHASGLEITYTPDPSQPGCYIVTVKFYRDCLGITPSSSFFINVSSASCGQNLTATANQINFTEISPICPGYPTDCDPNPPPPIPRASSKSPKVAPSPCVLS